MPKIALDAGHGLKTSGKQTPDGIKEWTLNDKVRDKVVEMLKDYDVTIINTDNDEGITDESLSDRLHRYQNIGVDAFVSIHHNAYTGKWNNATGVEVYTDKNYTPDDLKLAELIYKRLVEYTGLRGRGVKHTNFYVINQNEIPAVLCEGGFMDGTDDYNYIISDEGQTAYAKAVAEGLIEFLNLSEKNNSEPEIEETKFPTVPFTVEVIVSNLNYRAKPSMEGAIKGQTGKGVFTIVEVSDDWGKLKSGAGWIYMGNENYCRVMSDKKSIDEIAREVIKGLWGKGNDRKNRLTKAGYDYSAVQKKVNELL